MDQLLKEKALVAGEKIRLGTPPGLNKYSPLLWKEVVPWEFFNKPIFSHFNGNPKRGMEASLSGALDDAIMQVSIGFLFYIFVYCISI